METREQILLLCRQCMEEKGCRFTLDDIVDGLGISKKTIYKYFLNKEAIIHTLIDNASNEIHERQRDIYGDMTMGEEEKLQKILTVPFNGATNIGMKQMYELQKFYPDTYRYMLKSYEAEWNIVQELLEKGIRKGVYRRLNIELIKKLLQHSMQMMYEGDFLQRNDLSYQEALEDAVDVILRGIRI